MSEDSAEHPDLARKNVNPGQQTIGEYPTLSWQDRLKSLLGRNKGKIAATAAATTAAAAIAATGSANSAVNIAHDTVDAATKPLELVLPKTSSEFTTPKEIVAGRMDVHIDGLTGRKEPNMSGDVIDWKKIKLVTTKYDESDNKTSEDFLDLSKVQGFSVENALIVEGQNPDGGATPGKWLKVPAVDDDGNRFSVYVSKSEQTDGKVDMEGDYIGISYQEANGQEIIKPVQAGVDLPNGAINHVEPLQSHE